MSKTKEYYMNKQVCDCAYGKKEYTAWRQLLATIGFISLCTFLPYVLWSLSALDTMATVCAN